MQCDVLQSQSEGEECFDASCDMLLAVLAVQNVKLDEVSLSNQF